MADWQQATAVNQGVNLSYWRTGNNQKPILVLCHGFADKGLCWSRTAEILQSDYDVLMPDARNHGESGTGVAGVSELAADIAAVLSDCGEKTAFVIGHSVGAATAAAFAAEYPSQVNGLILEDPAWTDGPADTDPEIKEARAKGFEKYISHLASLSLDDIAAQGKETHPGWHDDEFPAWAESKQQVRTDAVARLELGDWRDQVGLIECQTLLVHGDQDNGCDGMISSDFAQKIASLNERIQISHVTGAGHNLRREQFELFVERVQTFLRSLK